MLSATDQNVLEAIAHSLEFEVYTIDSSEGREVVHGLSWDRLLLMSGLTAEELEASTIRLAALGLIACEGASHSVFDWLLGQRKADFFWTTPKGHRLIIGHDNDVRRQHGTSQRTPDRH